MWFIVLQIFRVPFCNQRKGKISIGMFLTFDPLFILTMQCRKLQLCTYRNRQYFSLLDCSWTKSYRKSTEQKLVTKIQMLRSKGANCTVIENCWNKSHIGSSTLQGGTKVMVQFASFDWTINFAPPHDGNHICWLPDWCYRLSRQENTHLRVEQ